MHLFPNTRNGRKQDKTEHDRQVDKGVRCKPCKNTYSAFVEKQNGLLPKADTSWQFFFNACFVVYRLLQKRALRTLAMFVFLLAFVA